MWTTDTWNDMELETGLISDAATCLTHLTHISQNYRKMVVRKRPKRPPKVLVIFGFRVFPISSVGSRQNGFGATQGSFVKAVKKRASASGHWRVTRHD